jgi:protein involved in polysaccharide export with SLBB domain
MMKKLIILLLVLQMMEGRIYAQSWLGKDLTNMGNINVKELTEAQRQEVLSAAKAQGLNISDLEFLLKSKSMSAPDVVKVEADESKKAEKNDTSASNKKLKENVLQSRVAIFGQQLFEATRTPLVNNANVAPTKNYILGIGDNVTVRVYGLQEQKTTAVINKEGSIFLPYGGKCKISGLTIDRAEALIRNTLIQSGYASLATGQSKVSLSMEDYHSIQVVVWGALEPGSYTLPVMSTIFDVLYLAKGPGTNRSYRHIQVIRNQQLIAELDLYDFLTKGTSNNNIALQTGDIVFVPYYEKRVRLRGEVKTPAIFELKGKETLKEVFEFAGGYTEIAYQNAVQIMRYGQEGKEFYSVKQESLDTFTVLGGEIVDVQSINNIDKFKIELVGSIKRPGFYSGTGSNTLSDIIEQAGGLEKGTVKNTVLIRRDDKNGLFHYVRHSLQSVLDAELSVYLMDGDVVYFMDSGDINHREGVQILGQVRHPGSYEYGENLSVGDLIFMAGGFNSKAIINKVILSRKVQDQNILAEILQIEAQSDYWNNRELFTTFLKPGDVVSIYINPFVRDQVYVSMEGEINNPGVYPIDSRSQTLWDVYQRVGGVNNYGILNEAVLIRMKTNSIVDIEKANVTRKMYNEIYSNEAEVVKSMEKNNSAFDTIALVNLNSVYEIDKILKSIVVEPGDRFIVPKRRNTVRIEGAVYNPNMVFFNSKTRFKEYILMGGGLMSEADLSNVFVTYANGTSKKTKVILGIFKRYPKVAPGSVLTIPLNQENRENEKLSLTERLALYSIISTSISSLAVILTAVIN